MAAKRRAGSQLTQDNWEEENEVEVVEDGSFRVADETVLAKRKMKKATRRLGAAAASTNPSPFGAFKGFSSKAASGPAESKPSFGSGFQVSSSKPSLGSSFQVSSSKPQLSIAPTINFGARPSNLPSSTAPSVETDSNSVNNPVIKPALNGGANTTNSNSNSEYFSKLKSLNLSVSSWIQQHVSKNPVCDLTPVFNDYRKHMSEIERKYGNGQTNSAGASDPTGVQKTESTAAKVQVTANQGGLGTTQSGGLSFAAQSTGVTEERNGEEKKTTGLFGQGSNKIGFGSSGITFGTSAPSAVTSNTGTGFSFVGAAGPQKKTEERAPDAADEDEPPKPEVRVIEEKDALFSIRSKLYYKKDGQFKERGVGLLHLKKPGKAGQLLMRADTTLGNIIFNISVPKALPVQRQGKNNVMLMAAMNPPPDKACPQCSKKYVDPQTSNACEGGCAPEPTAILLRVKTGDDADRLLAEINKLKD